MKIEVTREELELLNKLARVYFFGLFQKLGIAKSEKEEYRYRDALFKLSERRPERC